MKPVRDWPFSYKLVLSYLLLLLISVLTVGLFAYTNSVQTMRDKTRDNLQGTLRQIRDNIHYHTSDLERITDMLYFNQSLHSALRRYEQGWYSYETMTKTMMPTLENLLNYTSFNIGLSVYLKNDTLPELYYSDTEVNPLLGKKRYEVFHLSRIEEEGWYKTLALSGEFAENHQWRQVQNDESYRNISLLQRFDDIQQMKHIGVLRVTVQLKDLLQAVDYRNIGGSSTLIVRDADGRVMMESAAEDAGPDGGSGDTKRLLLTEPLDGLGWRLEASIPESLFDDSARRVRSMTVMVCLVSVAAMTLLGMAVSGYLTRRIRRIVVSLNAFRDGDLGRRITFRGNDEFAQIAAAFNKMGMNIEELIQQNYMADLQKKEAELESLQAQINPHFLYNTLSSISRLAQFGDMEKLQLLVQELAKFYRLSLNRGEIITTVAKEVDHAKAYVAIQCIKHGTRLQVYYDIDPNALSCSTVKLILQPMIENALEHAWFGSSLGIRLVVVKRDREVVFKVIDNGIGMSPDTITRILDPEGTRIGYGIRNVDSRVRLHYGETYGVRMASGPGIGTCVEIVVPCQG